mgnify:FL=1
MEAYQRELQERMNKIKLDEMEKNLERTKKIAGAYKASTKVVREDKDGEIVPVSDDEIDDEVEFDERIDVVELITDN